MRTLNKNTQTVYYALFAGKTEGVDQYGNRTGEYTITYSPPMMARMNISAARNNSDLAPFGIDVNYDYTIVIDDVTTPIDTSTIFWVGKTPDTNGEAGAVKHNAKVVRVARSINSVTLALKGVDVT